MAEKKKGKGVKEQIVDIATASIVPIIKDGIRGFMKKAQDAVYHTQKKVMDNFLMGSILLAGLLLIIIGAIYFINDYFSLDRYWGFLIVGVVLIIIALVFRKRIEKTKYYQM